MKLTEPRDPFNKFIEPKDLQKHIFAYHHPMATYANQIQLNSLKKTTSGEK